MNAAYYRFKHVFQDEKIKEGTRLALDNAVVVSNALYGCQVWNVTADEINNLETVQLKHLRMMLGMSNMSGAFVLFSDSAFRM